MGAKAGSNQLQFQGCFCNLFANIGDAGVYRTLCCGGRNMATKTLFYHSFLHWTPQDVDCMSLSPVVQHGLSTLRPQGCSNARAQRPEWLGGWQALLRVQAEASGQTPAIPMLRCQKLDTTPLRARGSVSRPTERTRVASTAQAVLMRTAFCGHATSCQKTHIERATIAKKHMRHCGPTIDGNVVGKCKSGTQAEVPNAGSERALGRDHCLNSLDGCNACDCVSRKLPEAAPVLLPFMRLFYGQPSDYRGTACGMQADLSAPRVGVVLRLASTNGCGKLFPLCTK